MIQLLNKMMIIQVWKSEPAELSVNHIAPNEPFPREAGALFQSSEVLQAA